MVKITPFKGITYNKAGVETIKDLVAPPYDVISPQYQETLYNRNDRNIVRLILGKIYESDTPQNNRYTRASKDFSTWLEEGTLIQSDTPKIYYYIQKYKDTKGADVTRKGFIARCFLEDFSNGAILPHEETMGGPKKDRLDLMMATNVNFSQIFSIYSDPEKQIDNILTEKCNDKPMIDILDDDNVRHIFYEISDPHIIDNIQILMINKSVLIADGHHRYETALKYRDFKKAEEKNNYSINSNYNYVMMYFANMDDDGLRVYPTHRLLKKINNISLNNLLEKLDEYFVLLEKNFNRFEECFTWLSKESEKELPIGFVCQEKPNALYILKPDLLKIKGQLKKSNVPEILSKLDVSILHRLIFENLMGLDTIELKNQNNIEFVRDEQEVINKFNNKTAEMIFLLGSPDVPSIKEICASGLRMPQKTTYFYPKLLSGLVINPLK